MQHLFGVAWLFDLVREENRKKVIVMSAPHIHHKKAEALIIEIEKAWNELHVSAAGNEPDVETVLDMRIIELKTALAQVHATLADVLS
jgi:Holliday junction resolvasome RuvABC DNA-binding subunit